MRRPPSPQALRAALGDPSLRLGTLAWAEELRTPAGYRLWSGSPPHLLATCFAVFLRELLIDLPEPSSPEAATLADILLAERHGTDGLFQRNLSSGNLGPRHDHAYVAEQQTHFALQALRLLGRLEPAPAALLERWSSRQGIHDAFSALDWRDPWRESNRVMFALYLLEHELARTGDAVFRERIADGLDWLRAHQDPATGCWGRDPARRLYPAVYGAYHYLFFFLRWEEAMPGAARLLDVTRRLQTTEGFFAHTRGGGACEDYDCVDVLVKLGDEQDREPLLRAAAAVLAARNADGGFPWARPAAGALPFVVGNWMEGLSARENLRLLAQRLRDVSRRGRHWRYSGLAELDCPATASDLWSTWFRLLILAEIDDRWLRSGAPWGFRSFPSLGWHIPLESSCPS
jgi:hypothetical protein